MIGTEELLDELGCRARALEPNPSDVEAILRRVHLPVRRRARPRPLVIAGMLALLLLTATIAAPTTRNALGDAVDAFFGGLAPGHSVNGQFLTGTQVPRWLLPEARNALVVAGSGKDRLIAYRDHGGYCFLYGTSVGECADGREWARELAQNPVVLRGPTGGLGHPTGALYGFTRGDVTSVRLTFATRPPLTTSARNGGFAISTDARWQPQQLQLRDAHGHTIAKLDVKDRFSAYR